LPIAYCKTINHQKKFDIIYFDAFAKIYQLEMWTVESLSHALQFLKLGGVFVTYAITGELKRMLVALFAHRKTL